ncbi:MAG: hypothetical protein ACKVWV_16600 [Planctomycetota bacterium]
MTSPSSLWLAAADWIARASRCAALGAIVGGAACFGSCISASAWTKPGNTIVVDEANGPGAQFTDIPDAVAAAAPGDLVLVRPGEYSSFLVNKAITILGAPNGAARVARPSSLPVSIVGGIPAGEVAVIADLAFPATLSVWGAKGTVAVDGCSIGRLIVPLADDVRVYRAAHIGRVEVQRSHVEIVSSSVGGGDVYLSLKSHELGVWGSITTQSHAEHAWPSVAMRDQSKLICALTSVRGRHLYWTAWGVISLQLPMTEGTSAISVQGLSTLALIGTAKDVVRGADATLQPGVSYWYGSNPNQRSGGHGVELDSGQAARSGVQLIGGVGGPVDFYILILVPWFTYDGAPVSGADEAKLVEITPDNPTLELLDTPVPGSKVRLRVRGPANSQVKVEYGAPTIVPVSATRPIETLVAVTGSTQSGALPSSGELTFDLDIDPAVEPGWHVFLQARLTLPSGAVRVSNSVLLVAR